MQLLAPRSLFFVTAYACAPLQSREKHGGGLRRGERFIFPILGITSSIALPRPAAVPQSVRLSVQAAATFNNSKDARIICVLFTGKDNRTMSCFDIGQTAWQDV